MQVLQFDRGQEYHDRHGYRDSGKNDRCRPRAETEYPLHTGDRLEYLFIQDRHRDIRDRTSDHCADQADDHILDDHRSADPSDRVADSTECTDVLDIPVDIVIDRKDDHDQADREHDNRKRGYQTGKNIRHSDIAFFGQIPCIDIIIDTGSAKGFRCRLQRLIVSVSFGGIDLHHLFICIHIGELESFFSTALQLRIRIRIHHDFHPAIGISADQGLEDSGNSEVHVPRCFEMNAKLITYVDLVCLCIIRIQIDRRSRYRFITLDHTVWLRCAVFPVSGDRDAIELDRLRCIIDRDLGRTGGDHVLNGEFGNLFHIAQHTADFFL